MLTSKGLATRARIVEHAAAIARDRGVAQTSLECVRSAANVSNSQLFHYFPDGREALMLAVARFVADSILEDQVPRLSGARTWRAWEEWADNLCSYYESPGVRCDMTTLLGQLDSDTPGVRDILADFFTRWERAAADGIRAMQAARKVRPDVNADATAAVLVAGIIGSVVHRSVTGTNESLRTTLHTVIAGLRG